ncbi:MAG: PQQ-binding-like beta-propeller repeat protein [Planctomycetaceae bacterium]
MIRTFLTRFLLGIILCSTTVSAADWPQWRGEHRDGLSSETGLLKEWPAEGPRKVWMSDVAGLGYAGIAVVGDTLYTMGAREDKEFLIAINAADGSEKWSLEMGPLLTNGWGDGPRGTPTVVGDHVYALSGQGHLHCAKVQDGTSVWSTKMSEFGGKAPNWGYTESVLVDGDRVVCTPGGKQGAIVALNRKTGETLWQSKDFTEGAQYASITVVEFDGIRQYVQLTQQKLVGLNAETGAVVWQSDWNGKTAVIPTPIHNDGKVYISSGYGVGCKLVQLEADGKVSDVYVNQVMKNHHGGVILVGNHLYGYSDGPGWICQDFATGEMVWNEKNELGKGAIAYADGMFVLQDEGKGTIMLIEASPEGWKPHGKFTLAPQTTKRNPKGKIWTHPTISNGKLYLRDQELLFCFDITQK